MKIVLITYPYKKAIIQCMSYEYCRGQPFWPPSSIISKLLHPLAVTAIVPPTFDIDQRN